MSNLLRRQGPRRVTPMELLSAEHDAAILREQRAADTAVLLEFERPRGAIAVRPDPACLHEDGCIVRSVGSTLDGASTHYLFCAECDGWYVVFEDAITQTVESRPMTEAEQQRFAAAEDRADRDAWLEDHNS